MQFSLGKNSLENYISQDSNQSTDSLRTINDITKLEWYLKQKKDVTFKIIDNLWRRIEQCESTCMQLSDSVDASYSRINEDNRSLNIERYEDLLPYSFKEVEWTKSSRVATVNQNGEKMKMVEKYQNSVSNLQCQLELIETQQQKILSEFTDSIIKECEKHKQVIQQQQISYKQGMQRHQQILLDMSQQLSKGQIQLSTDLQELYKSLSQLISNKLNQIEQQIQVLSK